MKVNYFRRRTEFSEWREAGGEGRGRMALWWIGKERERKGEGRQDFFFSELFLFFRQN
jgi:hypothetical protein